MLITLKTGTGQAVTVLFAELITPPVWSIFFPLINDGGKGLEFATFREQLIKIVDSKNPKTLRSYIRARASFVGNTGCDMIFKAFTREPKRWTIPSDILRKGGKFKIEKSLMVRLKGSFMPPLYLLC